MEIIEPECCCWRSDPSPQCHMGEVHKYWCYDGNLFYDFYLHPLIGYTLSGLLCVAKSMLANIFPIIYHKPSSLWQKSNETNKKTQRGPHNSHKCNNGKSDYKAYLNFFY